MLAIQPTLLEAGTRLSFPSGNNTKHTQEPTSRCQTNGAALCTLIANENIRDLLPKLVWDTKANSPLLEPIGRVTNCLIKKRGHNMLPPPTLLRVAQLINQKLNVGRHSSNSHRYQLASNLQHQRMDIVNLFLRTLNEDLLSKAHFIRDGHYSA